MYIKELRVDGYGALQDLAIELAGERAGGRTPNLTVIYGLNEAGKSTLLRFVRSMLYGFPTRKDPVERGEPVLGGRHGGSLLVADKSGRQWRIERHAERSGELRVRDETGVERIIGQPEWERLMLGGVSERLFRQLFAVSLNELHELRSLQGEELGNYLYHAGLAGGSAITAARRKLGSELDKLYRPKGSTQEMNRLLGRMKEIETSIRQSRDDVQYYRETTDELSRVEDQLLRIEKAFPELRIRAAKLQGAYELREWWLKREVLLAEDSELRSGLVDPDAPLLQEETAIAWAELKAATTAGELKLSELRESLASLRMQREKLAWDEKWVAALPELQRLESIREGIAAKRDERSELEAERRMMDEAVRNALSGISAEWGESELLAFGGLTAEKEQVRRLNQTWEEAERATGALQAELRKLDRQIEVLLAEERALVSDMQSGSIGREAGVSLDYVGSDGIFVPRTKPALFEAWHQADDARREYELARANTAKPARDRLSRSDTNRKEPAKGVYAVSGLIAAAAVALTILLSQGDNVPSAAYLLSASLLLLSVCLAVYGWRRQNRPPVRGDETEPSNETYAHTRKAQAQLTERLGRLLTHPETATASLLEDPRADNQSLDERGLQETEVEAWRRLRSAVYEQVERLEEIDRGRSKGQELQSRIQELIKEKDLIELDAKEQRERIHELRENWQQWLRDRKLPAFLMPDVLPELMGATERGQVALRQRQRITERLNVVDGAIREFEQAVAPFAEAFAPPPGMRSDPMLAVQWLHREADEQLKTMDEAQNIDRLIEMAERSIEEVAEDRSRVERGIAELLRTAGVISGAEFEQRIRIDERCSSLRKEAREIQLRLESGRDFGAQAELYELLGKHDEASLAALLEQSQEALAAEEALRSELLDKRGRLAQELDRLRKEAEAEDKRHKLSDLQAQLERVVERYAIVSLADRLIVRTKAVYEEEKQPEVLRQASRYFRQMTGGKYERIVAPGDSKSLFAETKDRRTVDSVFLSRGTQEQLYLAMRFALCGAASPEQPLPLLLDDLFVHFDESRLKLTLPVLENLAESRQVILFTCHGHAARTLTEGIPDSRMVTLGG
ncbi:AAA family ATPase [Cohnella terricola]|uniref:AAA family ATPase n=1 Tax=Cohnella terricola TaxID=1289167 RepID=A0A559JW78_9BACL|nr:AAA family ATPase [Cohnella terricola]TVY04151.1 AAA family ATPase [Cohnella terricola]